MYEYWEDFCVNFWEICRVELRNVSYKNLFIFSLIVFVFIHISCWLYARVKKHSIYFSTELMIVLLISYSGFIAEVTILNRTFGSQARVFDTKWLWIDVSMVQNITNLLNIILFIPFGTLVTGLQMNIKSLKRIFMVLNYSFLISLIIECIQYITKTGYFEIDDIEANILGGLIGSIFFSLCSKIGMLICHKNSEECNE